MKRSPMPPRSKPMKRTGRLAQRSAKRVQRDADYRATHAQALERDQHRCQFLERATVHITRCELGVYGEICGGSLLHVHHIRRRAQGGTDDLSNLVTVCSMHHRWIHDHPALAVELGLLATTKETST